MGEYVKLCQAIITTLLSITRTLTVSLLKISFLCIHAFGVSIGTAIKSFNLQRSARAIHIIFNLLEIFVEWVFNIILLMIDYMKTLLVMIVCLPYDIIQVIQICAIYTIEEIQRHFKTNRTEERRMREAEEKYWEAVWRKVPEELKDKRPLVRELQYRVNTPWKSTKKEYQVIEESEPEHDADFISCGSEDDAESTILDDGVFLGTLDLVRGNSQVIEPNPSSVQQQEKTDQEKLSPKSSLFSTHYSAWLSNVLNKTSDSAVMKKTGNTSTMSPHSTVSEMSRYREMTPNKNKANNKNSGSFPVLPYPADGEGMDDGPILDPESLAETLSPFAAMNDYILINENDGRWIVDVDLDADVLPEPEQIIKPAVIMAAVGAACFILYRKVI